MVALVFQFSSFAGRADRVLRPTQKHRHLCHMERTRAVLERSPSAFNFAQATTRRPRSARGLPCVRA
jgi:hypothetical protein